MPEFSPDADPIAHSTARLFWQAGAVHVRPGEAFDLGEDRSSPVFIDAKRVLSYPRTRQRLIAYALQRLEATAGLEAFDAVAGGETGGIPYAAWVADALMLPMLYVRKKPKGFGRNARIEGRLNDGQRVLLVDDVTIDGSGKASFATALRDAGAVVEHSLALVAYSMVSDQAEPHANPVRHHQLCGLPDILNLAPTFSGLTSNQLQTVAKAVGVNHAETGQTT